MMMNHSKPKIILAVVFGAILFLSIIYLAVFGRALRQPENHMAIAFALPRIILNSEAVHLDEKTILAKDAASFIKAMEQQGFVYVDQLGAGHFFKKDGDGYVSISRMYSSHFMVFTYPIKY